MAMPPLGAAPERSPGAPAIPWA